MDERQLQPLLRNAIVSLKMVIEIEKVRRRHSSRPWSKSGNVPPRRHTQSTIFAAINVGMSADATAAKLGNNL
jgi:hypothetical protein